MFLVYPYTDLYNLNLDWMIKAIKEVQEIIENLGSVVNTFNERDGNVVLTSEDVNNLEIDSVVTLPEGSFDTITEAQKTAYYEAGKRIIVALNTYGNYSRLGFLYKAGAAVGMAEYVPTTEEYAVLSFNGRTGRVTLTGTDINNLEIQPVLQIYGSDVSSLTNDQKLQYFDAGIRFIQCIPTQGSTLTTQKLYNLRVQESGSVRIPILVLYDPLQGQGLVKAVNNESPNNQGQLYLWADGITMANDDTDTVYDRIRDLEDAAVTSVNGETPTQGAVVITGGVIQVAADDDTTIDEFAVDVYSELEDRVKSVNGVTPTSGAVTVYGTNIAMSSSDATTLKAAIDSCEKKVVDGVTYIRGYLTVADTGAALTDEELLQAVWNELPSSGMVIVDFIATSASYVAPRQIEGHRIGNSGNLILWRGSQLRMQPLVYKVANASLHYTLSMVNADSLGYSEPEHIATRAYTAGDFIFFKNACGIAKKDIAIGNSLSDTANMNIITSGFFNQFKYRTIVINEGFNETYISAGTLTFKRLGPLKWIYGTITFKDFQSATGTYVDIIQLPTEMRPVLSAVRSIAPVGVGENIYCMCSLLDTGILRIFKQANLTNNVFGITVSVMYF